MTFKLLFKEQWTILSDRKSLLKPLSEKDSLIINYKKRKLSRVILLKKEKNIQSICRVHCTMYMALKQAENNLVVHLSLSWLIGFEVQKMSFDGAQATGHCIKRPEIRIPNYFLKKHSEESSI